jgi:hypothetical protein
MAIKPDDCIVPYGKLVRWVQNGNSYRDYKLVYDVAYLENFNTHCMELFRVVKQPEIGTRDKIRDEELAKFNAVYKTHKKGADRDYIKFKSHADLTYFVMRWA